MPDILPQLPRPYHIDRITRVPVAPPYAIGIGTNAADKESRKRPLRSTGLGLVAPRSVSARPSLHAENYTKFPFAFSTRHRPHTLRPRHLLQYVTQAKQQECTQSSLLTKQRDSQISHRDNNEQQHPPKSKSAIQQTTKDNMITILASNFKPHQLRCILSSVSLCIGLSM